MSSKQEVWGTFGDFVGGSLNPILSFLALIAILITINLQNEQLKISSDELHLSREELKKSADALIEQSQNIKKQNFENTFFNMLNLHANIISSIDIKTHITISSFTMKGSSNNGYKGKKALSKLYYTLDKNIEAYKNKYNYYQADIGHYFRNIYLILKLIDKSEVDDKKFYTNLFRAQFSNDELGLLFFNGLTYGKEKAKPLMEKYEFLEPLTLTKDYDIELVNQYDKKVFGKNKKSLEYINSFTK